MSAATKATWHAKVYAQRKADGLCVKCGGAMLPEWPKMASCPDCNEKMREWRRAYRHTAKGRKQTREYNRRPEQRVYYREWQQWRREAHGANGLCKACKRDAIPGRRYCTYHRAYFSRTNAEYKKRKRLGLKPKRRTRPKGRRLPRVVPIRSTEKRETNLDQLLRVASRFDEFGNFDIREATGWSSNRVSVELRRAAKRGRIVRIRGGHGDHDTAYRIATQEVRRAA